MMRRGSSMTAETVVVRANEAWAGLRRGAGLAVAMCLALAWTGCKSEVSKHYERGTAYRDAGEFEKAAEEFNAALAIDANDVRTQYRLANMYKDDLNDPDKAIEHFRRVVEIDPQYAKAWRKLEELYLAKGDEAAAIKAIQDAIKAGAFDDKPDEKEDMEVQLQNLLQKGAKPPAASAPARTPASSKPALPPSDAEANE